MQTCDICGHTGEHRHFMVREMMFGMPDEFEYSECGECGCLSCLTVPDDMSKYYPADYYSFEDQNEASSMENRLKRFLRIQRTRQLLFGGNLAGRLMLRLASPPAYFSFIKPAGLNLHDEILDVGCGIGSLLNQMQRDGFRHLTGIDPFIAEDIFYPNGVTILKKEINELDGVFDFIILNHVFEHMAKPEMVLRQLKELLRPGKFLLIRTPVAGSFAWQEYAEHWVQLDAPRHLFVHTQKSMQLLATKAGLQVCQTVYESMEFQFWGSEQYRMGIPLRSERSYAEHPEKSIFSREQIAAFRRRADELNRTGAGDSASFYLQKQE